MKIENYIEAQLREIKTKGVLNPEFLDLYENIENNSLREILASLHKQFESQFKTMNERLPTRDFTNHFWAEPSRDLLWAIDMTLGLQRSLKNSKEAFEIDEYYFQLINKCLLFLSKSGGSTLPENMDKVELYYLEPIFRPSLSHRTTSQTGDQHFPLKNIGGGSYANIYKYKDENYDKHFALKQAKKELTPKELERFKREFEQMKSLSSPYILEVYRFDENRNQYTMEYMDYSLDSYFREFNNTITIERRKNLGFQVLKGFAYLESKELIHRDISPKNILLKKYEDILVVKISDFGLVKTSDSSLTAVNTEFKGYFNDPALATEGFHNYGMLHETYALTKLLFYIMTGKTNTSDIKDLKLREFVHKGLNPDRSLRYRNIDEVTEAFRKYIN